MAVPMVFLNGQVFGSGRMSVEEIVAKLDTGAATREAAKLDAKDPYEVLLVRRDGSTSIYQKYA
jgi:alkyl hydroperoxide reductase subunit F